MAFTLGKNAAVIFDEFDLSSYFSEFTFNGTVETPETTTFGKSAKAYITGLIDGKVTLNGLFDGAADAVDDELAESLGQAADSILSVAPEGIADGKRVYICGAKTVNYEVSAPVSDVVKVSAEFQGNVGVFPGWSLKNFGAVTPANGTATARGTAHNNGAATTKGLVAVLHVKTNSRTDSTTIKLQDSADNATFADISGAAFASIATTVKAKERIETANDATIRQYVRVVDLAGAGTGTIDYFVAYARKNG